MKIKPIAAALVLVVSFSSLAAAADICISDQATGPSTVAFRKVKKLKPGGAVPLSGVGFYVGGTPYAVTGTAAMTSTGTVKIFVHLGSMAPGACAVGCIGATESILADATFAGTGNYDNDGDGTADAATTWTAVDCATVVVP